MKTIKASSIPVFKPVCGDACFNHGLSATLRAIEARPERNDPLKFKSTAMKTTAP